MNVRPLWDRIIVQCFEEGEQHIRRLIVLDTAKEERPQGKVIAAGRRGSDSSERRTNKIAGKANKKTT